MCRLALFRGIPDELQLCWGLSELEMSMGGHGNGVFAESLGTRKGINLACTDVASEVSKISLTENVLFHTRLASAGGIQDELCHPFEVEGEAGQFVLAHNGHWSDWGYYSEEHEESDTQCMARLVAEYGVGVLLDSTFNWAGVMIVAHITDPAYWADWYVVRRSGEFWINRLNEQKDSDSSFFHSSEPLHAFSHDYKSSYSLPVDKMFRVRPSGRIKEAKYIEPVTPKKARHYDPNRKWFYSSTQDGWTSLGGGVYKSKAGTFQDRNEENSESEKFGFNDDLDFECMTDGCKSRTTYMRCEECIIKEIDESIAGCEIDDAEYRMRLEDALTQEDLLLEDERSLIEEYMYRNRARQRGFSETEQEAIEAELAELEETNELEPVRLAPPIYLT